MLRKVTDVIDGDSFKIYPDWSWRNESGDEVRVNGYDAPEKGDPDYERAKEKLKSIVLGNYVELKNFIKITYGRLLCDVYIDGKNLADYFPEYQ